MAAPTQSPEGAIALLMDGPAFGGGDEDARPQLFQAVQRVFLGSSEEVYEALAPFLWPPWRDERLGVVRVKVILRVLGDVIAGATRGSPYRVPNVGPASEPDPRWLRCLETSLANETVPAIAEATAYCIRGLRERLSHP